MLTSLFGGDAAGAKFDEIRATFATTIVRDFPTSSHGAQRLLAFARSSGSGIMLAAFQQFVGINVIFYYGATLWQLAGFSEQPVAA